LADDQVKQVKEANDIVAVVGGYLALRPAGPTFKGLCPFHNDSRPSFDVDPRRQRYRCWSCGKYGDVISFVQEHDKISFPEALELLARRAGITLEKRGGGPQDQTRSLLLDVVRWAAKEYHECLLDSDPAEEARAYLGKRGLTGETVRRYGLGYAPAAGDWLVQRAAAAGVSLELLEKVGLVARRKSGDGHYDRFRDRVQFPIRDVRGQPVGFGGRILPSSPLASRAPKYYNSCDTPLFSKSSQLYGIDQARAAAARAGYLAVVEGYTDVLMAHQQGVGQVVATMGTALNARHVQQLGRFVPRVVLVFDADAGGDTGVDRALAIFASHEIDLAVATLPPGLDPCDLLLQQGADAFRRVLEGAADALDFKLKQVLGAGGPAALGVEGLRRAVDAVLGVIALAPSSGVAPGVRAQLTPSKIAVKTQLMVSRIAQRLALKEETVWARLDELRARRREEAPPRPEADAEAPRQAPAAPEERELLELLLAEPALVPAARAALAAEAVEHPGLRRLLEGLYALDEAGEPPTLDQLRPRLANPRLAAKALEMGDVGRRHPDRPGWLQRLLSRFQERRQRPVKQELQNQLHAARDHDQALELLRRLQNRNVVGAG
jgi:DNA primase